MLEVEGNKGVKLLRGVCRKIDVTGREFVIPIWSSAVETSEK